MKGVPWLRQNPQNLTTADKHNEIAKETETELYSCVDSMFLNTLYVFKDQTTGRKNENSYL